MTGLDDILKLDAVGQADLIRQNEVTPRELVTAAIQRIEQFNGKINAVVSKRYEGALRDAEGPAPEQLKDSPLWGVPYLYKDLGPSCAGLPTTVGSAFLDGFVSGHDSELVLRFKRAGLLLLGKSNTAEFGVLPTTEPAFTGVTRNPWNLQLSVGGSSGGAAAAVAAGLVPVAHANDAGGSIRIPASCCGVFGLKPTRARVPMGPDVGDLMNGLASEFVVSRSVRDSAALLDAVAGPSLGDPYFAPPVAGRFLDAVGSGPTRPLRIAVTLDDQLHPECVRAIKEAAGLCADLGHEVVSDVPPVRFSELHELFLVVWAAGVSSAISSYAALSGREPKPELFEETTWWLYEEGRRISAARYLQTITRLQQVSRRLASFYARYDVHLSTVTSEPAPKLGVLNSGAPRVQLDRALKFVADTSLANLTGQPAMSVPLCIAADGTPVGVHFSGRIGDEACLLSLAGQLETARPWANRLPSLSAHTH
ncbi:amidase [Vitiosangium sp. GDMCC 1.1324]|uniref:amidase n=1 Tax=Vitiosangium sp. (strain GDMCC 1.1324) TaxID=2138576 RepID=UPI000D35649D|nr:amidase family protein [Vitiosangium sp. GDMCC 1.1324]PTL81306.1 amidase [Vitiosangium sp. GDMCC 1.1324]